MNYNIKKRIEVAVRKVLYAKNSSKKAKTKNGTALTQKARV